MPKLIHNISAPYNARHLFDLVADIESYPEFLPWCEASRINKRQENIVIAELAIKYKIFRGSYISKVTLIAPLEIIVELVDGPFKKLQNYWKFTSQGDETNIEFILDFELKSRMLETIVSREFEYYSNKMMEAFLKRAASTHQSR